MRRVAIVLAGLATGAAPAFADDGTTPATVVILRGSSAPPTPWYETPPEPRVIVQPVYVPFYYWPVAYGPLFYRQPSWPSAKRNR